MTISSIHHKVSKWAGTIIALLLISTPLTALSKQADTQPAAYRLDTGDIVDVDIYGIADFKRRASVNVDGDLSLPFLGALHVAGLTLAELRQLIVSNLVALQVINQPQVTVEIAEHRPFYISGDVSRPGAIPFRKGLVARHAIALAGGYDVLHFRTDNPLMITPDLKARQQAQRLDLLRNEIKLLALQAELADQTSFEWQSDQQAQQITPQLIAEIIEAEQKSLITRQQDWALQLAFQQDRIKRMADNVVDLDHGLKQQSEALNFQANAVERVADNVAKGITPINRGAEERRGLAQIKSQEIESRFKLAQAQTDHAAAERALDKMKSDRIHSLNRALEEASIAREKIKLEIKASQEKLLYTGAVKAQMGRTNKPDLLIYRTVNGRTITIEAEPDTEIQPGDLLDVMINHQTANTFSQ